jgi:hypothetical protein
MLHDHYPVEARGEAGTMQAPNQTAPGELGLQLLEDRGLGSTVENCGRIVKREDIGAL